MESVTLQKKKWELVSMDDVDLYEANYFLWISITTFHEKLMTQNKDFQTQLNSTNYMNASRFYSNLELD